MVFILVLCLAPLCEALAIRTLNIPGLTRAVTGAPGRPAWQLAAEASNCPDIMIFLDEHWAGPFF